MMTTPNADQPRETRCDYVSPMDGGRCTCRAGHPLQVPHEIEAAPGGGEDSDSIRRAIRFEPRLYAAYMIGRQERQQDRDRLARELERARAWAVELSDALQMAAAQRDTTRERAAQLEAVLQRIDDICRRHGNDGGRLSVILDLTTLALASLTPAPKAEG